MRKVALLAAAAVLTVAACKKTGEGEYQATTPDVDVNVGTDTTTVRTPSIDAGTKKDTVVVTTPTVDVKPPAERKP